MIGSFGERHLQLIIIILEGRKFYCLVERVRQRPKLFILWFVWGDVRRAFSLVIRPFGRLLRHLWPRWIIRVAKWFLSHELFIKKWILLTHWSAVLNFEFSLISYARLLPSLSIKCRGLENGWKNVWILECLQHLNGEQFRLLPFVSYFGASLAINFFQLDFKRQSRLEWMSVLGRFNLILGCLCPTWLSADTFLRAMRG
jgi:hypothetical protein